MLSIQICPLINPISVCARMHTLHHVWLFTTQWTVACQALLSMGFSRQEYWSGCHFLLRGIFPTQGSNLCLLHLLALTGRFLTIELPGKPQSLRLDKHKILR